MAKSVVKEQATLFEGYEINRRVSKFRGTVEIDGLPELRPYQNVRLEVLAKVIDTDAPDLQAVE
jgi:hypothetical protein